MSGTLVDTSGAPRTGTITLVASLYAGADDTTPVWTEQQTLTLGSDGRYVVNVGSTLDGGVPKEIFANSTGHWLGVGVLGEAEQPRVMLVNVPYAVRALDADQLNGKTASDFVLSSNFFNAVRSVVSGGPVGPPMVATANFIPKYVDSGGTVTNSIMSESSGKIGVNVTSPLDPLHVQGIIRLSGDVGSPNYVRFDGTANASGKIWRFGNTGASGLLSTFDIYNQSDNVVGLSVSANGFLGVGTTAPQDPLHLLGIMRIQGVLGSPTYVRFDNTANAGGRIWRFGVTGVGGHTTFDIYNQSDNIIGISVNANGNVGIGTVTPTAKLDVSGSINVAGNINAKYQDVAEWVETSDPLEDGTVVIVDPSHTNRVVASTKAYDSRVAGAVSRQPGMILGEKGDNKAMIAANGRVLIKVDASYGAIKIGDLLVTSPTPGYAMKSKPIKVGGQLIHRPGTILGKALEARPNGKGEILVLLMLQ